jgi:peptide/nickel transport system substrate-binding protein
MITRQSIAAVLVLFAGVIVIGCDRGDSGGGGSKGGAGPTTSTTGESAGSSAVPKVGLPAATAATYKPVVGKYGGRLVRGQLGEPKSFNPIVSSETSTSDYTQRMFEGLTRSNAFTGDLEPALAESWEVSPDGLAWTFKLRKDVLFNDGTSFTAEDVVFTVTDLVFDANRPDKSKDPRWPSGMRDILTIDGKPVTCEALDPYTVKFTTPARFAILAEVLGSPMFASKKKYAPAVANGSFGGAMSSDAKSEDIVGTGPWMFGSYSRGERVILKRNPKYWRKDSAGQTLPYLDEIVFLLARNFDILYLQFEQGETDLYHCLRGGKDVAALRPKQESGNFTLHQLGADHGDLFLALNMNLDAAKAGKLPEYKVKWFRDQRFRQAISHAIDRTALVRNIYRNLGYPMYSSFTVAEGPFKVSVPPIPRDLTKSKALLADMGLKDRNGDGVLEDEQGNKVQFSVVTNSGNTTREEMCNYITTDLKALGMEVNPLFLEFNQLVDRLDVSYDWEAMIMAFTSMLDPHWGSNYWKSNSRNHLWWPEQKTPGFPWEKRIDELFAQGIQELDREKRKGIYAEVSKIAYEQQPTVYLAIRERVDAIRNKFGNVFPSQAPLWEFAALHNEDELFLLDGAGRAPAKPAAAAAAP